MLDARMFDQDCKFKWKQVRHAMDELDIIVRTMNEMNVEENMWFWLIWSTNSNV